jgi:hypothetical protein
VSVDDLVEAMEAFEDEVQSVDINRWVMVGQQRLAPHPLEAMPGSELVCSLRPCPVISVLYVQLQQALRFRIRGVGP